eukprot:1482833-Prymnesium_polylepis.1
MIGVGVLAPRTGEKVANRTSAPRNNKFRGCTSRLPGGRSAPLECATLFAAYSSVAPVVSPSSCRRPVD